MDKKIYQTKGFMRQLSKLKLSGRKGNMVAAQAGTIIAMLGDSATSLYDLRHKETKFGEMRLSNCRKYDLSGGYRLITVHDDDCLILAWIGSHDECHFWLEKQRETTLDTEALKRSDRLVDLTDYALTDDTDEEDEEENLLEFALADDPAYDPYEEALLEKIDQETLRQVFRGLCRESSCRS
ncbi:hypothetical protein ACHHRT_02090 [Desulfurivibrio sp. D14AmB]|uniref:hypothetical protein n=1 Tax=Desulfurivibrio sp. D14AmB TaxID=3374370 RepID=UPI00376EF607